jgi:hypothetical protein
MADDRKRQQQHVCRNPPLDSLLTVNVNSMVALISSSYVSPLSLLIIINTFLQFYQLSVAFKREVRIPIR